MWKLVIEDDEGKRTVVPLTREDYSIGRKEGNTIRLTERNVSREHARVVKKAEPSQMVVDGQQHTTMYALEDVTSYNGVYVNGLRVASAQDLVNGDLIQIGDYRMVLQDDQAAAAAAPPPPAPTDPKTTIPTGAMNRGSLLMERPNRFVMLAGPTPGAEFPLDRERMTIGRAEEANISVNHNSVSRLHSEVHDLGEGRFEIVDKGSSNGVRVNGSELKRGIVEAGDVIELGDVKFKFVGAGQIFLPGVNDTAQLAAIADRVAGAPRQGVSRSQMLPYAILGAVLAAIVLLIAVLRHRDAPPETPTVGTAEDHDSQVLTDAKRLCDSGDCDQAHEMLATGLAETSVQRTSPDFKEIERKWAESTLTKAATETDIGNRRALLQRVAAATTVDPELRKTAADQLQTLDLSLAVPQTAPDGSPNALGSARPNGFANTPPNGTAPTPGTNGQTSAPTMGTPNAGTTSNAGTTGTAGATGTTGTAKPSTLPAVEQAKNIMISDPFTAKSLLVPRLASGHASRDELQTLKTICKDPRIGDKNCVDECNRYLSKL